MKWEVYMFMESETPLFPFRGRIDTSDKFLEKQNHYKLLKIQIFSVCIELLCYVENRNKVFGKVGNAQESDILCTT